MGHMDFIVWDPPLWAGTERATHACPIGSVMLLLGIGGKGIEVYDKLLYVRQVVVRSALQWRGVHPS